MELDAERLASTFTTLCEIDSPSRGEAKLAVYLVDIFHQLGASKVIEDTSASATGSDCGNFVIRFAGSADLEPVFFNCHLDVIDPCRGVKVVRRDDVFYSSGSTVLGADDKAGIAVLIEVLASLAEYCIDYGPVEILLTTCEEIGLLGAKAFDPSLLQARYGYALDSTGVDNVIVGAPAAVYVNADFHGLASHAGLAPQCGISALQLASQAICRLPLGRLDDDSTANIGLISGGTATNIIPDFVSLKGEIRSHSLASLGMYVDLFGRIFQDVVDSWTDSTGCVAARPSLDFSTPAQYPLMLLDSGNPAVLRISSAAENLSRTLSFIKAGGGSDANVLSASGLSTAILGTGMTHVHSCAECVSLADMLRTAELVTSILTP